MKRPGMLGLLWTQSSHPGLKRVWLAALIICSTLLPGAQPALSHGQAGKDPAGQDPVDKEGWVVLPVEDYRALHQAAYPVEAGPPPPPVEAALSRVDYDLKIDGDLATGEARLSVDVIKDGWVRVPMPSGLTVRDAQLDGRMVQLVTESKGTGPGSSYLLLSHTGRSVLRLSIVAPVSSVAGTDILQLPVGASAISRASIELPRKGVDVRITGGLLLERSETSDGTRWVANGRGNESLTFAWRRRVDDVRSTQPLRLRGSLTQVVGLGEDTTQLNAEVQIDVLQGSADEVKLRLPDQFAVNNVQGATVADWATSPQQLAVKFIEPVQQGARFVVTGEIKLPRDGQIDVPMLRLPAAERETGALAVEVMGAGEIKDRNASGLVEAEASEMGQLISSRQSPSLIAFRMQPAEGQSSRRLTLGVARYTPQSVLTANIEEARYSVLVTDDGKMLVQSRFAVRNNQRSFLKVSLPRTAVMWSATVAGRPIRPGLGPDGSMLIALEKTRGGEDAPAFIVEVAYLDRVQQWNAGGRTQLSLAAVDLPISKSGLLIHYSPLYRLIPAPGSFRVAPYEAPATAAMKPDSGASRPEPQVAATQPEKTANELVSRMKESGRASTPARNLPIRVAFPHFGPSIYLVSELTGENQTPIVAIDFQRDKKAR